MQIQTSNRTYEVLGTRPQLDDFVRELFYWGHLVWDAAEVSGVQLTQMRTVENTVLPEGVSEVLVDHYGQVYYRDAGTGQLYKANETRPVE